MNGSCRVAYISPCGTAALGASAFSVRSREFNGGCLHVEDSRAGSLPIHHLVDQRLHGCGIYASLSDRLTVGNGAGLLEVGIGIAIGRCLRGIRLPPIIAMWLSRLLCPVP